MGEIKTLEVKDVESLSTQDFKAIKPETDISFEDAKNFLASKLEPKNNEMVETNEFYGSYKNRIDQTPIDSKRGYWEGERGESKFIPSENIELGKGAIDKLKQYNMDGIEYRNGQPDFKKCSEESVIIKGMSANRELNFKEADKKVVQRWNAENKNNRNNWTEADVYKFRKTNHLTWHECCDRKTMMLVPQDIHRLFTHWGGVAECKERANIGGEFDE